MVFIAEEVTLSVEKSIMSPNCKAQPFNSAIPSSVGRTAIGGYLPDTPGSIGPTQLIKQANKLWRITLYTWFNTQFIDQDSDQWRFT